MAIQRRMLATTFVVVGLAASLVFLVECPIGASGAPVLHSGCPAPKTFGASGRGFLSFNVCGPRDVARGGYDYMIVVTNAGRVSSGKVTLTVFHDDRITHSSIPYRASHGRVDFGMYEAVWRLGNLAPGRSSRVRITVSFRQHKKNSAFTELVLRAAGQYPGAGGGMKKDVFFK